MSRPVIIIMAGHIVVMVAVPPVGSRMPIVMTGVVPASVAAADMDAAATEVKPEARGLGR